MREIVLDTETTGLDPKDGHRMVEIGCVELLNHIPTGKTWHYYINPEREIPAEATAVHGITNDRVKKEPIFAEIVGSFADFIEGARLVIHNAEFDVKFLNYQMKEFGYPAIKVTDTIDTLLIARKKFPGQPANLDALCRRFNIDLSGREFHGALLDAQLLADVYLELSGGRQHGLELGQSQKSNMIDVVTKTNSSMKKIEREYREPRVFSIPQDELDAHEEMIKKLKEPLWKQ
jgi:DNA polymerase-3 subunit epsilon